MTTILVVCEIFEGGGLETHIAGQARALAGAGIELVLATGSSAAHVPKGLFGAVLADVPMGPSITFNQLRETLSRIVAFGRERGAGVVHAHPFYSSLIGLFAAQEARLPLILSLHGPLSITGVPQPLSDLAFRTLALREAGMVLCVSPEVRVLGQAAGAKRLVFLPNAVAVPDAPARKIASDAPWMWAGRIDDFKLKGLLDLIERMRHMGRTLRVFGDGPAAGRLRAHVEAEPRADFVRIEGWRAELGEAFAKHALVAGMGRVMLEGAASGRPCLLVGYDGVKGLLDVARMEEAAFWNLSGRGLPTLDAPAFQAGLDDLEKNPERYRLRDWIAAHRDERAIWSSFASSLAGLAPLESSSVAALIEAIRLRGRLDTPVWEDADLSALAADLIGPRRAPPGRWEETSARPAVEIEGLLAIERGRIADLEARLAVAQDSLAAERNRSVEVETRLTVATDALAAERAMSVEREARVHAERDARLAATAAALEAERSRAAGLEERMNSLTASIEAERNRNRALEERAKDFAARLEAGHERMMALERELAAAEAERQRAAALESENASLAADRTELAAVRAELDTLRTQFAAVDRKRNDFEYLLEAMRRSNSWRVTEPVRMVTAAGRILVSGSNKNSRRAAYLFNMARTSGARHAFAWVRDRLRQGKKEQIGPDIAPLSATLAITHSADNQSLVLEPQLSPAFTIIQQPFDPYELIDPLKPLPVDVIDEPFTGRNTHFSCVTTVKNEAASIVAFMDSIKRQSALPKEVIIVDGGSTDSTVELIRHWSNSAPFEVKLVEAGSVNIAKGRNIGAEIVSTDIIIFVDAGSTLRRNCCRELAGAFVTVGDLDVACGIYEAVVGNEHSRQFVWDFKSIDLSRFLPSARVLAVRTSTFRKTSGFPEHLTRTGEDTLFAIQIRQVSRHWAVCRTASVVWDAPVTAEQAERLTYSYAYGDGESGYGDLQAYTPVLAKQEERSWLPQKWIDGYKAGRMNRAAVEVERRGIDHILVLLSGVPFTDSGGGQRCSQLAMAFARQNCKVIFVNIYPSFEEKKKLYFDTDLSLYEFYALKDFSPEELAGRYGAFGNVRLTVISEFPHPSLLPVISTLKAKLGNRVTTIYDYIDNWQTSLGWEWYSESTENIFIRESDHLVASARTLQQKLVVASGRHVALIPNAVNDRLFDRDVSWQRPADLPVGKQIVLYTGAMWGDWFDWDLVLYCAEQLPHVEFIMIGGHDPARQAGLASQLSNLHFLGLKPQRDLPAYLAHASVGIIPFVPGDVTNFVNPLKVYEYVAMGLPVVATQMVELAGVPGVKTTNVKEQFVEAISQSISREPPLDDMVQFTSANNWDSRIADFLQLTDLSLFHSIEEIAPADPADLKRSWPGVLDPHRPIIDAVRSVMNDVTKKSLHELEFAVFQFFDRPNDLILDIGANSGQSIVSIRSVAPTTPIKAFEPNPLLLPVLEAVGQAMGNVDVFPFGLGSVDQSLSLFSPVIDGYIITPLSSVDLQTLQSPGQVAYMKKMSRSGNVQLLRSTVHVRKGDDLEFRPTAIKVDVEGFEIEVVRGLRNSLVSCKPLLMIEKSRSAPAVAEFLLGINYDAYRCQGSACVLQAIKIRNEEDIPLNIIYVHRDAIHDLIKRGMKISP